MHRLLLHLLYLHASALVALATDCRRPTSSLPTMDQALHPLSVVVVCPSPRLSELLVVIIPGVSVYECCTQKTFGYPLLLSPECQGLRAFLNEVTFKTASLAVFLIVSDGHILSITIFTTSKFSHWR